MFRKELAWREFYADVLHHHPDSARTHPRPELADIELDQGPRPTRGSPRGPRAGPASRSSTPGCVSCWPRAGCTTGVRMVTASFLVKDLHLDWTRGARHFMRWLRDGDLASNQHGWQWVAGTGTDAAPYFRVFNPVTQGLRLRPRRRLRTAGTSPSSRASRARRRTSHGRFAGGSPAGYPARIVDHASRAGRRPRPVFGGAGARLVR